MTPFKFGKKQKSKEKDSSTSQGNGHNNDSAFSSPSSQNQQNIGNDSPTISNYSNNSQFQKNQPGGGGGVGGGQQAQGPNQYNSPGSNYSNYGNSPAGNQSNYRDQGFGIAYDQNNNYHAKSPQRHQQQGVPKSYGSQQPQAFQKSPPAMPQYGQPIQPSGPPPQRGNFKSPWTRSKLLISPFPRYRHAASSYANEKGEVFVMGGLHNTSVYGDTWILKPDSEYRQFQSFQVDIYDNSPAPRVGHASTLCGNAYVIFGGDTVTNEAGEIDNDLYLFNMNSHAWTVPKPTGKKPSGRYGHTIGVIAITNFDSKLYLYGGQLDDVVYNDLCVFNLSSFRRPDVHWEWVHPSDNIRPPPLTNHSMDVYDNKLWIFGGSTGKRLSSDLWCFDPQLERWDKIKTLGQQQPEPVEEHASVIYKDLMIVYGGKNTDGEAVNDLFFLNLITKTWFKFPTNFPLEPQGKYGHTLSILKNDKLLILGGHLPDYANLGENLDVSNIDNGVGTILNLLDLTNLPKLVPGLQQYSTPNRAQQDRFPNQQSIFTPQKTPQQHEQHEQHSPIAQVTEGAAVGAGVGAAAIAATAGSSGAPDSISSETQQPGFQKSHTARQYSAEDVFQRDQRQVPSSSSHNTPSRNNRLDVPLTQPQQFSSPEEELPLQIPSPIKTENEVPGSFPAVHDTDGINREIQESREQLEQYTSQQEIPRTETGDVTNQIPGGFNDEFKTPNASPSKTSLNDSQQHLDPQIYKNEDAKNSDFLDSYVNGDSKSDLLEKAETEDLPTTEKEGNSKGELESAALGAGAIGAAGAAALNSGGKSRDLNSNNSNNNVDFGSRSLNSNNDIGVATRGYNSSKAPTAVNDNHEIKKIIASLSQELEDLKVSTNFKIKEASSKVRELEEENSNLKNQLGDFGEIDGKDLDEKSIKRRHIKLNTDYQILNKNHSQLKSRLEEVEPVFSANLLDLQKLNNIIKQQSLTIEETQKSLNDQEDWKLKHNDLEGKYQSLQERFNELSESRSKEFNETHADIKHLNTGLESFLARYLVTDEQGSTGTRSLNGAGIDGAVNGHDDDVTTSLKSQIDELLKENEELNSQHETLQGKYSSLESSQGDELESLKAKIAELSKIEENYKDSLHSVKNTSRALQVSQSELSRQKEVTLKLQQELDELKLFRANRKSSRNTTPIVNEYSKQETPKQQVITDEEEEDIESAHYNLKIRDLQAELFITKQERDELKHDVLELKKKLLNSTPSGSF